MAATTRTSVPQVNLKDRIAALQQRNAGAAQGSQPDKPILPTTGSLRDKIANFEKKGAVPVPRGSFGLGAPPVDDGSSKRHGEMYGNRVPGLAKPTLSSENIVSVSPPSRTRRVSTSDMAASPPRMFSPTPSSSGSPEPGFESISEFGGSPPTSPRLPAGLKGHMGRRSVSDILTKFNALTSPVSETLPEDDEDGKAQEAQLQGAAAPVIVVSTDAGMTDEPEELSLPPASANSARSLYSAGGNQVQSGNRISQDGLSGLASPSASDAAQSPELRDASSPDSVTSEETILGAGTSENQPGDSLVATVDNVKESDVDDLPSSNSEEYMPSETDGPSANSSNVPTPTDLLNFPASAKVAEDSDGGSDNYFDAGDDTHIVVTEPPRSVLSGDAPRTPTSPSYDDADQSLAFDAIIVTQPVHIITPTRAVLVPVPPSLSPASPAASLSSPSSPASTTSSTSAASPTTFADPSLTPKSAQKSFKAVVHRKVPDALQLKPDRSARLPQAVQGGGGEPDTAGLGDLAMLLADAALLEQQLSGSPRPEKPPQPTSPAIPPEAILAYLEQEPATPRVAEPARHVSPPAPEPAPAIVPVPVPAPAPAPVQESPEATLVETRPEVELDVFHDPVDFPTVAEPQALDLELAPLPTTPVRQSADTRSLLETPPPPPPSKSPRHRYFSTLLPRSGKAAASATGGGLLSMPGAYPRNSMSMYSSGDSEEDGGVGPASDASSVRSSSKSTKSLKGLSRATSFADRLFHRNSRASASESHAEARPSEHEYSHVPPVPAIQHTATTPERRPQRDPLAEDRPASWFSVSSVSTTGDSPLDHRFFDSFPSVPSELPSVIPEHAPASFLSPPSRSMTLPPRHSSLPKRR